MVQNSLQRIAAEQLLPLMFGQAQQFLHDLPDESKCNLIGRIQAAAVAFLADCCSSQYVLIAFIRGIQVQRVTRLS